MKALAALALVVLATVLHSGCASLADAQAAKGSGTAKVYEKPYDIVWNAVLESVKASGLDLVAEIKDKGTILGQGKVGAFTWGENVAIFVEEAGGKVRTRVEVVNKRAMATNITARDWESRIFDELDKRLQ